MLNLSSISLSIISIILYIGFGKELNDILHPAQSNPNTIHSSCNAHVNKDGLYYIKPTENGPVIPVICSAGYTMIDASLNFDAVSAYFTSLYRYGDDDKAMYGTDCADSGGWRDWFIPADDNTKFRVARNCESCKAGTIFGDQTAYYMTSGYFCPVEVDSQGCTARNPSLIEDVFCNVCDDEDGLCGSGGGRDGTEDGKWCDCYTLQLTPDHHTNSEKAHYCQGGLGWRPNLVIDRSQCTCYQPQTDTTYTVEIDDLPLVSIEYRDELQAAGVMIDDKIRWEEEEDLDEASICDLKIFYLTQQDFIHGTYRIEECGHYILTEDIVVNFNKPSQPFNYEEGDSPNAYNRDNLHWFPTTEQQENGDYPGLDQFWGPFSIGFFAAIAIEHSHVWIDLYGYSISMDPEFYLQQRFFAIIELGNKQFEARQGPVDFGREDLHISDLEVCNGTIGLTSHHGIHGQFARGINIHGLSILNFDVGGIQCNGCKYMTIANCEIGPQNINIPVLGRYTHARSMLSRLRYMVDEYGDEHIRFANRHNGKQAPTVRDLADRFVEQMDMIYYHIIQGVEFDENDEQWQTAKRTFLNPTGWLDGASAYGILLNGQGTAVVNIGRRTDGTYDITIKNVEIHDLKLKPHENFWASVADDGNHEIIHGFFFETLDWNYGNIYDKETGYYLGDAYTDLLFAANRFLRSDFCPLGSLFYLDGLVDWVFTDKKDLFDGDIDISFRCGSDIQSHSGKGAIGIRIDGTKNYEVNNVHIHNLVNWGELGSDQCGEYEEISFETGVDVDKDIQYGYSGDNVHGILTDYATGILKDIHIEHLKSWHGSVHGIAIYKGSTANVVGEIAVDNLIAGEKLTKQASDALILPNSPPFVCSVFVGLNSDHETNPELTPIINYDAGWSVVAGGEIYGYDYCGDERRVGEMNEPLPPSRLLLNRNQWNVITTDSIMNYYNVQVIILAFIFTAFIVLVFCIKKVLCALFCSNDKTKMDNLSSSSSSSSLYGSI